MPKEEESGLTLDEMLEVATKVEHWSGKIPKDEPYYYLNTHNLIYTGCHKGVHVKLTHYWDPTNYKGAESIYIISASVQSIEVGKDKYVRKSEDDVKTHDRRIESLYDQIAFKYEQDQQKISREAAIRYARILLAK